MFERETRREKILEARNRELKLKEKAGATQESTEVIFEIFHNILFKIYIIFTIKLEEERRKNRKCFTRG